MSTMLSEDQREQTATGAPDSSPETGQGKPAGGFRLALANFNGPFDVLLHLITKRELDITEVALAEVTDEFIAYLRELQQRSLEAGSDGMKVLDETTEFLVVLEARDLLFARLLQYKAFKHAAAFLGERYETEGSRRPREVALEPEFAALLPELIFSIGPERFAKIAAGVLAPKPEPITEVGLDHLHGANVTIAAEAEAIAELLAAHGAMDFTALVADAAEHLVVVVRFLALLEMFRQKVISFEQHDPLGPLQISLAGESDFDADAVLDDYEGKGEVDHE